MTLASNTFCGYFLVAEEFIVGWLMKKPALFPAGKEAALLSTSLLCTLTQNLAEESHSTLIGWTHLLRKIYYKISKIKNGIFYMPHNAYNYNVHGDKKFIRA